MHPWWFNEILGNPQYPGSHLSHFSPPTPDLHTHVLPTHSSDIDPNINKRKHDLSRKVLFILLNRDFHLIYCSCTTKDNLGFLVL